MGKKYLLYIHDLRFESEAKKSLLVNRLLADYYGDGTEQTGGTRVVLDEPVVIPTESPLQKKANDLEKKTGVPHFVSNGNVYADLEDGPRLVQS